LTDYIELDNDFEFDVYPKRDVVIVRGENATVWDDQDRKYIDCVAGHGVANVGHCNPAVVSAVRNQVERLVSCPGIFHNDSRARLLAKLVEISPDSLAKAYLCNSGSESIEAAIKFARYSTGKSDFICAMRSFHGRTMGALSATFNPRYKKDFEPLVPGFSFVPFNDIERLKSAVSKDTAGVILEVVQGEGGVNVGSREFFTQLRQFCDENGILLIIDEVQTGFGRTGKMFACEHYDIQPDIMCLAKAIAGGIPMGAVLCSGRISAPKGKHGSTFGGNPLACEVALATIGFVLDYNLSEEATAKGDYFCSMVDKLDLPNIREVRHKGLMIGIELKEKAGPFIRKLVANGILVLPAGATVIRLLPPLTISREQLDQVVTSLHEVLR